MSTLFHFETFESDTLTGALGITDERCDELKEIAVNAIQTSTNKADAYAKIGAQVNSPQDLCVAVDFAIQADSNPLMKVVRLIKSGGECDCPKCRARREQAKKANSN